MVDMIVNDNELVHKLVFTNVKKRKNSDAYQKILPKLNQKYQDQGRIQTDATDASASVKIFTRARIVNILLKHI